MTARIELIAAAITDRSARGLVHAGPPSEPSVRYLLAHADAAGGFREPDGQAATGIRSPSAEGPMLDRRERRHWAVAVVDGRVLVESPAGDGHPAERLAARLADEPSAGATDRAGAAAETGEERTLLAPPAIPHDAALYVEGAGFEVASTDAIERARSRKTAAERDRIAAAQSAAGAGLRRAAGRLAAAEVVEDRLALAGAPLIPARLARAVDAAIVDAGGFPTGTTIVETDADSESGLPAGEPLVLRLSPREPTGYRGALTRTLVPGTDGGWERRAHVAVESALRSARTMLGADAATVREVETELVAEIGSFGFQREATATVAGVGLESRERPTRGSTGVPDGAVLALEAGIRSADGRSVALGDLLAVDADGAEWVTRPSRALDPVALDA